MIQRYLGVFILLSFFTVNTVYAQRYALVIGNSHYGRDLGNLSNPVNDASDMAKLLKKKDFNVIKLTNATKKEMAQGIRRFTKQLQQKQAVGLFFFAGHGVDALHVHLGFDKKPVLQGAADQQPVFKAVMGTLSAHSAYGSGLVSAKVSELLADLAALRSGLEHAGLSGVVMRVSHRMRSQLDRAWCVEDLAKIAGISQSQLFRRFKDETGNSPMGWLRGERMVLARYLLRTTEQPISHVALKCGYADPFHFSRDFKRHQGHAPRHFRAEVRREV